MGESRPCWETTATRTSGQRHAGERSRQKGPRLDARSDLIALQQSVGNRALTELMRQPAATGPAAAPAAAPPAATPAADASDPAVDALDLQPKAKAAANKLKKKFPAISFTSGRRDEVSEQASAMAGNVVSNRNWITETYKDKTLAAKLQKWLDDNPKATKKDEIAKGLADTMSTWTDTEKGKLSAHFTGEAFDIQPQTDKAAEIKAEVDSLAKKDGGQFLEKEGGLVRWHVQIRE